MITIGVIQNGSRYLSHHLRKNDYWTRGEKRVEGEWIGAGADRLNLHGPVEAPAFEALRENRHPETGEQLTRRESRNRMALFDLQLSAPKDVSVLAIVGGDERVREAFVGAVHVAITEMERFAAVRERRGAAHASEAVRLTGSFVGALFFHDASRDLDPQLHAHAVLANATWDEARGDWFALQPAEMMRASSYLRQVLYRELSARLRGLGYETYGMNAVGFAVRGVEHLRERYSKRSRQVRELAATFAQQKGRQPTKREVEVLVRESRPNKLAKVRTDEVRARQRAELLPDEAQALAKLVRDAVPRAPRQHMAEGYTLAVLESALRHVFERTSVACEALVLGAALELNPEFYDWRDLRDALAAHHDGIHRHGEMTLRPVLSEEVRATERVEAGRNTEMRLGKAAHLPESLTAGQRHAAMQLLESRDFLAVLVGDAGTGKTSVLRSVETVHRYSGGRAFVALAPTTRARDALIAAGFDDATTVQQFLIDPTLQEAAQRRVVVVDEAGLLSTPQLAALIDAASERRSRLLLVGDPKQHYSVERGDALRNIIRHSHTPVVRLSEVLRQRDEASRHFSRLLAAGETIHALAYAERKGMVRETRGDEALFEAAAEHYASNVARRIETLVVIPFWEEIDRFNRQARDALRRRGILGSDEVSRESVHPLDWTEEQKVHWHAYHKGDWLLFTHDTQFFDRGTAAPVTATLSDGLIVARPGDRFAKITQRHRHAFDVGRLESLALAAGDRLLIRGRSDDGRFANGDFKYVAAVDRASGEVLLSDGEPLPVNFHAWTYGHALTSYRSQGATAEESLLVLGEVAERALKRRQFYVGNTRFKGRHHIYVSHRDAILTRLALPDPGRELATEFVRRLTPAEEIGIRAFQRFGPRALQFWRASMAEAERVAEELRERP